jgi:hypothetical protein
MLQSNQRFRAIPLAISLLCWSVSSPADAGQCERWKVGDHTLPTTTQAECWKALQATGGLAKVESATLLKEESYYYTDVANTGAPEDASILGLLTNELERRKPPKGEHSSSFYSALLLSGQLQAAEQEREEKKLPYPPFDVTKLRPRDQPNPLEASYWTPDPNTEELLQNYVDLSRGSHVIIYTQSTCGPCIQAATALSANPSWREALRHAAIWVEVPDVNFNVDNYKTWNHRFPAFPINLLLDRRHWPQRDVPGTPYFFFLHDGQVISQMIGWTKKNADELTVRLREVGLL